MVLRDPYDYVNHIATKIIVVLHYIKEDGKHWFSDTNNQRRLYTVNKEKSDTLHDQFKSVFTYEQNIHFPHKGQ